jgi:hypothetical protein
VPEEFKVGCKRPDIEQPEAQVSAAKISIVEEEKKPMIKVGKPAPDFKASAFYKGKFMSTSLSDYKGKWVVLCFYPGDFTFV